VDTEEEGRVILRKPDAAAAMEKNHPGGHAIVGGHGGEQIPVPAMRDDVDVRDMPAS
jgi:hypothetical protein